MFCESFVINYFCPGVFPLYCLGQFLLRSYLGSPLETWGNAVGRKGGNVSDKCKGRLCSRLGIYT